MSKVVENMINGFTEPPREKRKKLIIHETDCHGGGRAYYNGKCTHYSYDDEQGDLKSAVLALISLGFIDASDVAIFEDDAIYIALDVFL